MQPITNSWTGVLIAMIAGLALWIGSAVFAVILSAKFLRQENQSGVFMRLWLGCLILTSALVAWLLDGQKGNIDWGYFGFVAVSTATFLFAGFLAGVTWQKRR